MRLMILPPLDLGMINGGRTRVMEVYSRLPDEVDVTFVLNGDEGRYSGDHFFGQISRKRVVPGYVGARVLKSAYSLLSNLRVSRHVDAIVCYSDYTSSMAFALLTALLSLKPLIITIHHIEEQFRRRSLFLGLVFRYASGILCLDNPIVVDELRRLLPGKRIMPVTNGVDFDTYSSGVPSHREGGCLFVGVLNDRKGKDALLEIWCRVAKAVSGPSLKIIAGVTTEQVIDDFIASADKRGIADRLEIVKYLPEREKKKAYWESRVFLFPSVYEGFGLVIAEAMASGLPPVIWDLPSFKRFSKGVVKVAYPDVGRFAEEVVRLLTDEKYREGIAAEGMAYTRERLSWQHAADVEADALGSILEYDTG